MTVAEEVKPESLDIASVGFPELAVAREAIALKRQIDSLTEQLERSKEELRTIAGGDKKEITVEGQGIVLISKPRDEVRTKTLVFNEERLASAPGIKEKLISQGILVYEDSVTPAAKASVTVKPNV